MGRNSYESLGKPPSLLGPISVISSSFQEPVNGDGPFFVRTNDEALVPAQQKRKS
ncbi:MAG: hypothetical protein IPO54_07715 [Micavibrio sp.]|nr:hypothetical protein [Micavibrio sp.]